MAYFNHSFRKVFVGTHATQGATNDGVNLVQAQVDNGMILSQFVDVAGTIKLKTSDLQSYGLGAGAFGFFDKEYKIVMDTEQTGCCPLYLVAASIRTQDKIGPFHGGYQESNKSKLINPKYIQECYKVEACAPRQAVVSVGSTPYTNGGIRTSTLLAPGAAYPATTVNYNIALTGGTGSGVRATVTVNGAGAVTAIVITNAGTGYTALDVLTVPAIGGFGAGATTTVNTVATLADAACCKSFLCGETYYLRVDVKGSPALRALNHFAYQTVDAYTGCCSGAVPTVVDPTLVYLMWAKRIVENNYLKYFVAPVVFDYTGVAWYAPGTTVSLDGLNTPVSASQWWTSAAGVDQYAASTQALAWTDADPCAAGMRLYGAYVDTQFANCSFQLTDKFEIEPVKIYASLVDYTGDPCTFEGLCVYQECIAYQGMGYGEQIIRDLILSESYLQNFFHTDIRLREITGGNDNFIINRSTRYTRYCILHSVPRFNNPSGVFDNDRYLLEIVTNGTCASLETFLETWLDTSGCAGCVEVDYETAKCGGCAAIIPG